MVDKLGDRPVDSRALHKSESFRFDILITSFSVALCLLRLTFLCVRIARYCY
jgi:hypothetical protein